MDAIGLLKELIAQPSFSREERATADLIYACFEREGLNPFRLKNNVWVVNELYDASLPTLMLNSHHDTVKPSPSYTRNPFEPTIESGKLYGLGSNDAGASVVALSAVFSVFAKKKLPFNILLAITAEEEVTGENGIRLLLPYLAENGYKIDMALVGEPTGMQPAIAERGLVVLDCISRGVTGHAARNEGVNAIYKAVDDIQRLRAFKFKRSSEVLGEISVQTTMVQAGRQHNVVPEECRWVVDVRTTDAYTNEETVEILQSVIESEAVARSTRVRASVIDRCHPLVAVAVDMGKKPFVSPTTSDMSQMSQFPSLKMGPGESSRSHTADEFIELHEIESAIDEYKKYLSNLSNLYKQ